VVALGHCYRADRDLWHHQLKPLVEAGYRVLRHDVRRHGQTRGSAIALHPGRRSRRRCRFADVQEIDRVHHCGIAISGMIAQWFAINHSQRLHPLTLSNTSSAYSPKQRAGWDARVWDMEREGPEALLERGMSRWVHV